MSYKTKTYMFKSFLELQGVSVDAYVSKNAAYGVHAELPFNLSRQYVEMDRTRKSYSIVIK